MSLGADSGSDNDGLGVVWQSFIQTRNNSKVMHIIKAGMCFQLLRIKKESGTTFIIQR